MSQAQLRCPTLADVKAAVKALKREVLALYYASLDPAVGCIPKIIIAVALAYVLSPIDLIPDFIPVVGWLDDLIIVPTLIWLALRLIPAESMQTARTRAENEPLKLSRHMGAAAVFLLIWLGCFEAVAAILVDHWSLAHQNRVATYAVATVLFAIFAFLAVLSESEEAQIALRQCFVCCTPVRHLAEPLLPT